MFTKPIPPTSHMVQNTSRDHPIYTKQTKNETPKLPGHWAMKQKMIHCLSITSTHRTPPNHNNASPPKIFTSQNLTPSRSPNEESNPSRGFNTPNTFPREHLTHITTDSKIERSNIKSPILLQSLLKFVILLMSGGFGLNKMKKSCHIINLPVIKVSLKMDMPLSFLPSTSPNI
jgi:hypothetical protein